jgi:glycosyltransferase involved in cell wall biosynthesis
MLQRQGVERPLFWVYDITNYRELLILYPHALVVLHATENYLIDQSFVSHANTSRKTSLSFSARVLIDYRKGLNKYFGERIVASLPLAHMVVPVSSGIEKTYLDSGYQGKILLIQNGVDQKFWSRTLGADPEPRVAVFQGAINIRLDFNLLLAISQLLPNWTFRFVGSETSDPEWVALKECGNVEYLGKASQITLRAIVQNSAVGIIPFKQVPLLFESFPLKAFEYIAAGLPVVSTPIRDLQFLQKEDEILRFADNPQGFASAIETLASSRLTTSVSQRRLALSADATYDSKFDRVVSEIRTLAELNGQTVGPSQAVLRKIRRSGKPNRGFRLTASFFAEGCRTLVGVLFSHPTG